MSPVSPISPTRPAPTGPKALAPETMGLLVQAADRNGDRHLGRDEAIFTRAAGADTAAYTGHVEAALERGQGFLSGFRLAAEAALAIADRFARGDAWVSKEDMDVSDAARARLDVNGDGRVARHELATGLQNGGLALNARRIVTAGEVRGQAPAPVAPARRPAPPPIATGTSVSELTRSFESRMGRLNEIYNATGMTRDHYNLEARRIVTDTLSVLAHQTTAAPLEARRGLLLKLHNDTSVLTNDAFRQYEQRLIDDALAGTR